MIRLGAALAVALICAGCNDPPPARGQVVLYVDTNLPVPHFADTLRIELLDGAGQVEESRTDIVADRLDWPVSFGVTATAGRTRVRLRLFPSTRISTGTLTGDGGVTGAGEPLPGNAVDRIVEVTAPGEGVQRVAVLLGGECLGVLADPVTGKSCVPGRGPAEPATEGLTLLDAAPDGARGRTVGTWSELREIPCSGQPRPDSPLRDGEVCVPGGIFFLGDQAVDTIAHAQCGVDCGAAPEHLVRMSPLFMGKWEVTVERWRAALAQGFQPPDKSWEKMPEDRECAFDSRPDDGSLAMNCVEARAAKAFCAWDGGRHLTSEAEWEYAASGRGEERIYPWDDTLLECGRAVYAQVKTSVPVPGGPGECGSPNAVGMPHPVDEETGDVSRDGVRGLAGNVSELTADESARYDAPCWSAPMLRDPICTSGTKNSVTYRGANWNDSAGHLNVAIRGRESRPMGQTNHFLGFRCARRGGP